MGRQLYGLAHQVGLTIHSYQSENVMQTLESGSDLPFVVQAMAERLHQHTKLREVDLDPDQVAARLRAEQIEPPIPFFRDCQFGLIARKGE